MRILFLSLLVPVLSIRVLAQDGAAVRGAARGITPADIQQRINVLAHDSMKGRHTTRPEIEKAARYVGAEFLRFGLTPLGDDGEFVTRYRIDRVRLDTSVSRIAMADGPVWRFPGDAVFSAPDLPDLDVTAPMLVLSGVGDTNALRTMDIRNAAVLFAAPAGAEPRQLNAVLMKLRAAGPAVIMVPALVPDSLWRTIAAQQQSRTLTRKSWETAGVPMVLVREQALAAPLARHGIDLAALRNASHPLRSTPVPERLGITLRARTVSSIGAPNVVGLVRGSDPALRNQYVVFSAHLDHVGVGRPDASGDTIYNGADDDASGIAAVIELAEAFASLEPRPKRSLIFLAVSGEELGLFGSDFFTARPPVPIVQVVANLNIDMVGRNWKDTIVAIGKEHSDLGQTLARVNAQHPELRMTVIDDPWPEESFYTRSDHYNFARRGVPALFFFSGTHADYHRPSDHAEKIDAEKESRIVQLIFYLGLELANAAERPRWNPESYRQIVK